MLMVLLGGKKVLAEISTYPQKAPKFKGQNIDFFEKMTIFQKFGYFIISCFGFIPSCG